MTKRQGIHEPLKDGLVMLDKDASVQSRGREQRWAAPHARRYTLRMHEGR